MLTATPSKRATQRPLWVVLAPLGLVLLTSAVVLTHRSDLRRPRTATDVMAAAALTAAPTVSVDFAASPGVTSPTAAVARFSIARLPLTAYVATISRTHVVMVARIGSLHGP
jgi:hypothetical protein